MDKEWRVANIWQLIEAMGLDEVSQGESWFASKSGRGVLCKHGTLEHGHVGHNDKMLYDSKDKH